MRRLNLFGLTLLLVINLTGQSFRDVIDRHNFGFTLERQGEIRIATASAKVIFYYEMPSLSDRNYEDIDCSTVAEGMKRSCQIHTYCGYSIIYTPVPKAVYKITNNLILLSNITQLSIKCENNDEFLIINLNEIQTVHKLH